MADEMRGMMPTLVQVRTKARNQMLDALSADHRRFVSELFGRLVVAKPPDVGAVARELDEVLTPQEKQAIEQTSAALDKEAEQVMTAFHQWLTRDTQKRAAGLGALPVESTTVKLPELPLHSAGMILMDLLIHEFMVELNRLRYPRPS